MSARNHVEITEGIPFIVLLEKLEESITWSTLKMHRRNRKQGKGYAAALERKYRARAPSRRRTEDAPPGEDRSHSETRAVPTSVDKAEAEEAMVVASVYLDTA